MSRKLMAFLTMIALCATLVTPAVAGPLPMAGAAAPAVGQAPAPPDPTKIPHYFGPYSNWANSPQVLTDALVTIAPPAPAPAPPVSVGNAVSADRASATDAATTFGVAAGGLLPAGTLTGFQTWNQAGTPASAGNQFHAYVLRPTATAGDYTVIFDSGLLTVPALTGTTSELVTFSLGAPGFVVQAGDLIGWYGQGIPFDAVPGTDVLAAVVPATAPAAAAAVTLGTTAFGTYSIAANVVPASSATTAEATATVDPKTGGITGYTITNPGSGYTSAPVVTITSPGVTPTAPASAAATISPGVVTSIAVVEPGFGFTTPSVAITGGGSPSTVATALASGGVDNLTIVDGGTGYATQPIIEFALPNLGPLCAPPTLTTGCYTQATGTATMDANGAVTGVAVTDPGSGYTAAPAVTILDANLPVTGTPATVTSTIAIAQIDVVSGGAGYDSTPVVTITDAGGVDRNASAVASVAVIGAVTAVNVVAQGAGYLTPGLKKFVDTLPGLGPTAANNYGQYIPVAVPDTTTYPGADYYEIAVLQYRQQLSSQLPATLLRGYVQLSTSVVPGNRVPLTNANLDPAVAAAPALLPDGVTQALGVDIPHYLGPTIVASKDRPVRILFRNLLPTGVAGNLFLPVDTTLMGSGEGPARVQLDPVTHVPVMAMDQGTVDDAVRNPVCNETPKPAGCYTENRETLHLHGGVTPWISDGTPHQWITPAGEVTDYPKGVSVSNVPDMPDPGPGAMTFFYTNQQSARLMFYHDHAWGITRLNVYAGGVAGYLVTDPMEQKLFVDDNPDPLINTAPFKDLGLGTPLIIQDKTFVSASVGSTDPAVKLASTDPTWNPAKWGGEGSLWTPHVYMPAQNPGDPSGMSAFGRWMYGPWFWPPAKDVIYPAINNPYYDPTCDPNVATFCEPALIPSTPNVSVGMEAFNDTPLVNGTAYPTTTVEPKAYRYRILNGANDRFWNLQWYVADPTTGTLSEVALKASEVAAAQLDPNVVPTPDLTKSPAGPNFVQIGTEGGFLPAPVIIPNQPITWIIDPTRFDVGNVDKHALFLAPAERADVIVDFSQYRGKTLILYNDAPAAVPARVAVYDYYTGGPDLSPVGAPTTLPGYGPNTRTIMQVKVSTAAPAVAFDRPNTTADRMGTLVAAWAHHADGSGVFESSMDPIIVGQAAYNSAYGTSFVASGWCNSPTNPSAKCDGYARIQEQSFGDPATAFKFKFDTLLGPQLAIPFQPKGMHDEMNSASFDPWGRMTANLGLEAPGATPLLQNIVLYPYVNPATEVLDADGMPSSLHVTPIASAADGTQIWKITHNGVDTHPIHWHLYDVQVLNRVTWDNIIIPPDPNELGWKETVRVSPLEDTIVALRPIVPTLPFAIPDSERPLNPAMPIGAQGDPNSPLGTEAGFNNADPLGNVIAPITNEVVSFGWEYVFHCHILSHEEMDMMRPVTVHVSSVAPAAVNQLPTTPGSVVLHWVDPTPVNYLDPATWANPQNEIGFNIYRADATAGLPTWPGDYTKIATALANSTTWTDTTGVGGTNYNYIIEAFNQAGSAPPSNSQNGVFGLDVIASSTTVTFGSPVPTITASYLPTSPAPADATGLLCSTTYTPSSPVGTYPTICSGIATPDPVYVNSITYIAGTVTVTPKALTVNGPILSIPYGAPKPALVPTYVGLVSPPGGPATPATCTSAYTQGDPLGTYPVLCSGAADPNYTFTYIDGQIAVGKAVLTVTAPSPTMPYGGPMAAVNPPTYAGFVNGETPASLSTQPTCSTTATASSPAGTYAVTCGGGVATNYTFSYVAGTLTIAPVILTVTAPSPTMPYGGPMAAVNPPTYAGFVNGETPASLSTQPTCSTTATASSPAGTYAVTCGGGVATNYTFSYVAGTLTIAPVILTVTASSGTMAYGGVPPTITPSYAGFVNGDTAAIVTGVSCSTTATGLSPVGSYPSTCTGAVAPSYTIAYVPGTVTVTPVAVTVTASNGTMVYGGTPPVITASYAGLVNGATAPATLPVCTPGATATSPVGSYLSLCSGASDPNYTFLYVPGTVTVTPAALTITAFSGTMAYGAAVPTLTPTYAGLSAGDTAPATPPTCVTTATSTSAPGTYPSTCSGAVDPNYTISYVAGTITVTKAATTTTVTSSVNPSVHGQSVTFTATVRPPAGNLGAAPTGTVQFRINGANVGGLLAINASGVATLTTSTLTTAAHPVLAIYSGNTNYLGVTSPTLTQTVTAARTTTTLTLVTPVSRTTTIRYTARVAAVAPGVGTPTGTVRFYRGTTLIGSATLNGGVAVLNYRNTRLATGVYAMHATYVGSTNFLTSTSSNVTQRITL